MKINVKHLVLIWLTLVGVISPVSVYSDSTTVMETNPISNNIANKHKTPNANQTTFIANKNSNNKKILIDDSRGLSAFFMLGIAINIIMIITFGWWFSKEWRRQKK